MKEVILEGDENFIAYPIGNNPPKFKIIPNEAFLERLNKIERDIYRLKESIQSLCDDDFDD